MKLVDQVSIQIRAGKVVAVVGPSGSGKSSFLRLLNRLDEPTGGTVVLDGLDYRSLPPRELRRRVGMLMQSPHLFPGTVNLRVSVGFLLANLPTNEMYDIIRVVGWFFTHSLAYCN